MSKINISIDGRFNNESWEVDEQVFNYEAKPHLKCITTKGEFMQVTFKDAEEFELFNRGAALCRAWANNVNRGYHVFVTLPQIPKQHRGKFLIKQ